MSKVYPPPQGRILIRKLANASKSCSQPAKAYGACILQTYKDVQRDQCAKEFGAFRACVQAAMGRKW